jgi:hypothetical protein
MSKDYREAMAEIQAVLEKYDLGASITVISKERAMFKYHFPTWSCIFFEGNALRFRSKRSEYASKEAQRQVMELSAHCIMQMRDIAAQTFQMCERIGKHLQKEVGMQHTPFSDFDPEHSH